MKIISDEANVTTMISLQTKRESFVSSVIIVRRLQL